MKKLLLLFPIILITVFVSTSCRFAPKVELGDTIAAKDFEPIDTAALKQQQKKETTTGKDNADIFIIGEGSTRDMLQLISYPSRRDTTSYGKQRPLKIKGSTQFGRIVRIGFIPGKDSTKLVKTIEEVEGTNP